MFLSSVCCIELACQVFTGIFMVWAFFILAFNFKNGKYKIKNDHLGIALTFFFSLLLPCFFYAGTNFHLNMMISYHVFICIFLFYSMFQTSDFEQLKKELITIFKFIVITTTLFSVIGMLIMFCSSTIEIMNYSLGLLDNRYTGLYTNPNLSAFCNTVGIMFTHFLTVYQKSQNLKILAKPFVFLSVFFNFSNLLLSDSNSSLILLMLYFFVFYFVKIYLKISNKKGFKASLPYLFLYCICFAGLFLCVFFIRVYFQNLVSYIMNLIHYVSIEGEETDIALVIGRAASKYEITSGRTDSLQKAFVLFSEFPLFGVGKANILEYSNRYLARGLLFSDLHNGYLTILVSCGILGFSLFMLFSFCVAKRVINFVFSENSQTNIMISFFSMLVAYCAFSVSEKTLLLDLTFMVVVFWLILGYTMNYINFYSPFQRNQKLLQFKEASLNKLKNLFSRFISINKKDDNSIN
ncbi:MAG: O-antigen ligase family protein [Clostridia bacterium]|nr:O-antigen ligase family protein [Clostridia bacterium]